MATLAALVIGAMQSLTTVVAASIGLTAFEAIIVPGTGTPHPQDVENYLENAVNYYVVPFGNCDLDAPAGDCPTKTYGVNYYATFWPIPLPGWGGLEGQKWNVSVADGVKNLNIDYDKTAGDVVIFGYSQGATVATNFKRDHANDPQEDLDRTDYFFIGDPQRPSGGFFERLAFLGNVPILDAQFGDPAPTATCTDDSADGLRTCATDFALQYDGVVDFPQWLLNPVALLNAAAGFQYVHGTYLAPDDGETDTTPYGYSPEEVQFYVNDVKEHGCNPTNFCQHVEGSDTNYITLPARYLPLYQPFIDIGDATGTSAVIVPIVDLISPATQTIIETGYNRTDYSKAQPGTLLPPRTFNPIQTAVDLVKDIPEGIDMAVTPGRTPLPGSPPLPTTTSTVSGATATNTVAAEDEATNLVSANHDRRTSLLINSRAGAGVDGSHTNRPLRNALKDFHPVRDAVKAVTSTVNKALGKDAKPAAGNGTDD
ncbi:hypothetical protein A5662_09830 [Mycobacteriaceae bacterium 1482268.1]|nr:hypothetical protein A5662_09830 [Mycobacteriaceae bacterium 1482268.1]